MLRDAVITYELRECITDMIAVDFLDWINDFKPTLV